MPFSYRFFPVFSAPCKQLLLIFFSNASVIQKHKALEKPTKPKHNMIFKLRHKLSRGWCRSRLEIVSKSLYVCFFVFFQCFRVSDAGNIGKKTYNHKSNDYQVFFFFVGGGGGVTPKDVLKVMVFQCFGSVCAPFVLGFSNVLGSVCTVFIGFANALGCVCVCACRVYCFIQCFGLSVCVCVCVCVRVCVCAAFIVFPHNFWDCVGEQDLSALGV